MKYRKEVILKNGMKCCIRNGTEDDGKAVLDVYHMTHEETDYLASYADESTLDEASECEFLKAQTASENEVQLVAITNGIVAGTASIHAVGGKYKVRHRAELGISILKYHWGLGIGRALTEACIECAKAAGYTQLELSVVADNARAVAMYETIGFIEYGRNPKAFNSRYTGYQEAIYMRLEL